MIEKLTKELKCVLNDNLRANSGNAKIIFILRYIIYILYSHFFSNFPQFMTGIYDTDIHEKLVENVIENFFYIF